MKRFWIKMRLIAGLALGVVCTGLSTPVAAQPVIHHVRIGNWQEIAAIVANQNCPNWCWAAASERLVKSQGICDIPQEEFVRRIYGVGLPCLPTFGSLEPIRVAITGVYDLPDGSQVALTGAYHYGVPTDVLGMIQSIVQKRPFIFAWQGHAWVAYGIKFFFTGPFTVQFTEIELIDPLAQLSGGLRPQFYSFVVGRDLFSEVNGTFELLVDRPGGGGVNVLPGGCGGAGGGAAGGGQAGGAAGGGAAGDINVGLGSGFGDVGGDGDVDIDDVRLIEELLGWCEGDANYNPVADLNGDGCIDDADLDLITILVLPPLDVDGDGDVDIDDVRLIEEPLR